MNHSTTAVTLNLQLPNIAVVTWAVQGDQLSRELRCTLVDGSTPWNPQTGYHGVIRYFKPDGTNGVYDVDEDGNPAVTWSGNVATVIIAHQAVTVAGTVIMQLEFYDSNDARVTAFGWAMNVQPSAVTDTEFLSTDYYNILTLQIAGVLGATGNPPYINSTSKNWMIWDKNANAYVDSGFSSVGTTGPAPSVTSTSYQYANSSSGTVVPTSWSGTRPSTQPGTWAWTETTITYDTGDTTVLYSAAYQGNDGTGAPGTSLPLMDGTAAVGTANAYAREDHVHPQDSDLKMAFEKTGVARLVGKKIAMYGDSWATATYGSLGKTYIESVTGETVHVVGSGSKTMAQIYTTCWDSYDADIYIIEGGLNDASLGTGATSFTAAIDTWLSAIRTVNADAEIYFITPPAIKEANQSTLYKFPLEFYRIGIWSCAPFKNYGVINGLKWFDVELRSDNVHPTQASEEKIGRHIVEALANCGDEETHTTEVSYLGRNDYYFRIDCINGTVYLVVFNFNGVATSANTCEVTLGTLDTVFSTSSIAFINQKTGGAGDITYRSNNPNVLTLYCYGSAIGTQFITLVIKMPVEVSEWVNPYI